MRDRDINQADNPVSTLWYRTFGCMDPSAFNYNSAANTDDGFMCCSSKGCTDVTCI